MSLSAVAGIIGQDGSSLRVVVTQRWRMRHHVGKRERLFVVPDLLVQEPVPWNDIPALIETVQKHIVKELAPTNHCGECRACCKTLFVKENDFQKPSGQMCRNCSKDTGCMIYFKRPGVCRSFECNWLKSQSLNDRMPPELRPDKCGAILTNDTLNNDPLTFEVHGTPNAAAQEYIETMERAGYKQNRITFYVGERK